MPRDTSSADDTERTPTERGGGTLAALLLGGVLGVSATGTASADSSGQVGTSSDPLTALYTEELNGGVTGDQSVTSLTGEALSVDDGALTAGVTVEDGATTVPAGTDVTFGTGLALTDDGDGTATVDYDTDYREAWKLVASDGSAADAFGVSTALSADGTTVLVGAYKDEIDGRGNAGSAYVFENAGGWQRTTKLSASDASFGDFFGESVVLSADGTTALLGARFDNNSNGDNAGAVYVFDGSDGWSQTKLTASDGDADDQFGYSVALSADGTTALVGARTDEDPNGDFAGSAYVFEYSGGWSQVTKLSASDGDSDDGFGASAALSADGTTALVAADSTDSGGSAYVFDGSGGWAGVSTETTKLTGDEFNELFGDSVALSADGTTALCGAPSGGDSFDEGTAYVFDGSDGWSRTELTASDGDSDDNFGSSVALSGDGTTALVGAENDEDPYSTELGLDGGGSAYVFEKAGGWSQVRKLSASDGDGDDNFGASAALCSNGTTALVGAEGYDELGSSDMGSVYIYYETV